MNLSLESIKLELPAKLKDICQFSFNFDNLMKVVDYLFRNNVIMIREIKDLKNRVTTLETLESEIEKLKIKTTTIEKTNDNINRSFIDMKERFIKNDSKISDIIKKNQEFQNILDKNEKIIEGHDYNLNNLNKVVEENIKSIKQIQENFSINLEKMQKYEQEINDIHRENIKTHEIIEKNKNIFIQEQHSNEKEIESINNNISELNDTIKSVQNTFDKKYRDFDNCINNIMDNIKDFSTKDLKGDKNGNNLFKLSMNEIEREREKFNSFIEENKLIHEKKDKENETFRKIVDSMKIEIDNINNKLNNTINNNNNNSNIEPNKEENKETTISIKQLKELEEKFVTGEDFNKLNEYIKKITQTISALPNREEFKTLNRNIMTKLKKLEKDSTGFLEIEAKLTKSNSAAIDGEKKTENVNSINTLAEKIKNSVLSEVPDLFKEMIKREGKTLDISRNPQILEIVRIVTQHSEEINNNNKTVIDLRKTIFAIEADKKFNILVDKTNKLEEDVDRNKKKIFELIKSIEGFEDEDYADDNKYQPETIKGKISFLEKSCTNLNDKVSQIESKYKSFSKEIKEDIKSNLRIETVKTVSQFREKLELFTRRFEEELRSKIDQMGLNNFEKRINTKIYFDLKDKLNRNEMQKNNNAINRKIDSLENKISKTLVDTIIDLQMDEAPLIIKKKSNNLEICASCNQLIPKDRGYISNTEQNSQSNTNINTNKNLSGNNKFRKTFYGFNRTQTSIPKINNVMSLKKELPDINKYY